MQGDKHERRIDDLPERSCAGRATAPAASRSWPTPATSCTSASSSASSTRATGATSAWRPRSRTPGDFKRTVIGERSVIMVRDADGAINVVENVCAHRGMQLLPRAPRQPQGASSAPTTSGATRSRATCRACRSAAASSRTARCNGGMPADFKTERPRPDQAEGRDARRRGVRLLRPRRRVASRTSWARRSCGYFDRLFNGRKLKILGYNRQRIPGNWKLMQENIKDPYHPGLLHTWFVTFGLWRADNKSQLQMDDAPPPRGDDLHARHRRQGRAGDAGVELQGEHAAQRPALPRHRARALVGRPDGGDDDASSRA